MLMSPHVPPLLPPPVVALIPQFYARGGVKQIVRNSDKVLTREVGESWVEHAIPGEPLELEVVGVGHAEADEVGVLLL